MNHFFSPLARFLPPTPQTNSLSKIDFKDFGFAEDRRACGVGFSFAAPKKSRALRAPFPLRQGQALAPCLVRFAHTPFISINESELHKLCASGGGFFKGGAQERALPEKLLMQRQDALRRRKGKA